MPHKKGYQICIFKTNELLVNTFEAINQQYHFLSTDRDIVAFKFLHGATRTSGVQPLLVCCDRQGCRRWATGSHRWPVHMVPGIIWWCIGADGAVELSRSVCICYSIHAYSGQWSEHSSSSHHCSCCLCRDPGLDASVTCQCLDAAAVSHGQWHLVQAKVAPPSPLTAAKGPLKQPQEQGRANPLEQQLCCYPWPRHTEENLARVWWSFPGCVLCEDPEPLIFMLKSLQGKNLEGAEFSRAFKIHAFKTHTFISWTAEISCCEIIFCENTNPPHTSHWKYFFLFPGLVFHLKFAFY